MQETTDLTSRRNFAKRSCLLLLGMQLESAALGQSLLMKADKNGVGKVLSQVWNTWEQLYYWRNFFLKNNDL